MSSPKVIGPWKWISKVFVTSVLCPPEWRFPIAMAQDGSLWNCPREQTEDDIGPRLPPNVSVRCLQFQIGRALRSAGGEGGRGEQASQVHGPPGGHSGCLTGPHTGPCPWPNASYRVDLHRCSTDCMQIVRPIHDNIHFWGHKTFSVVSSSLRMQRFHRMVTGSLMTMTFSPGCRKEGLELPLVLSLVGRV